MTRRIVWIGLLVLGLLVLGGAWFLSNFERVPVKERGEEQAEARRNRYLALERFLGQLGRPLTRQSNAKFLDALPAGGTLILDRQRRHHMQPVRVDKLLDWVAQGGYLIAVPEAPLVDDPLLERLDISRGKRGPAAKDPDAEAADDADAKPATEPAPAGEADQCSSTDETAGSSPANPATRPAKPLRFPDRIAVAVPGSPQALNVQFRGPGLTAGKRVPDWRSGVAGQGDQLLHYRHGQGHITIAAGLDSLIDNRRIGQLDHAELLWTLLQTYQPEPSRPVVLAARLAVPRLWEWLGSNAATALVSGLVLLGLALWRFVPRFGPPLPEPVPDRRELREHLAALGRYLWRAGGLDHWLRAAREAFLTRLAIRHPALAALPPAEQAAALARLTRRSPGMISAALYLPASSPPSFTAALRTLRNLERNL